MKKYWIVSQVFYPDETSTGYVMTQIAETVLKIGEVNVICGPANYHSTTLSSANKLDDRIKIYRVNVPSWNKNNLFSRLLSFIVLTFGVAWKVLFKVKRIDTLILVTNPPTLILFLGLLKRIKGFKMFVILQDVFPENLVVAGLMSNKSFIYKLLSKLFNASYNQADHIIACGADMKNVFTKKIKKDIPITVITNWADHLEIFEQVNFDKDQYYNMDLSNKIVIQFAGNIGRVQGLDKFLNIYHQINNKNLFLIIIGDGAFKEKLLHMQQEDHIQNILFLPPKPRTEQNNFLNACDIGLVTLSPGMYGLGVPSKTYNILAAGKPLLFIGDKDSEISQYINGSDTGWAFTWDESEKIVKFLNDLNHGDLNAITQKGKNSRRLVDKYFTREVILNKYKELLFQ